jgi:hypothetical protein
MWVDNSTRLAKILKGTVSQTQIMFLQIPCMLLHAHAFFCMFQNSTHCSCTFLDKLQGSNFTPWLQFNTDDDDLWIQSCSVLNSRWALTYKFGSVCFCFVVTYPLFHHKYSCISYILPYINMAISNLGEFNRNKLGWVDLTQAEAVSLSWAESNREG